MSNENVFAKLQSILSDELEVDKDKITMESNLVEDLGADSMAVVDLVMTIEDDFGVAIPDDVIEDMKTVGDAVRYIESEQ